jgi:Flp pilus assembly protein TadB
VAAVLLAGTAVASIGLPALPAGVVVAGGGLAAFLWSEQRLIDAVTDRHEQLRLELPVVAEQLGMLLGAGWSLGSAMNRLADRGRGAAAQDLAVVCGRIRHGLSEGAALAEWAERTDLVALHRLVSVLALDRHTSDIGRLIAEEARSMRLESHRALLEAIERRSQAVWIPVTVAALVPGVLFLAVPFVDALRLFTAS